MPIREFLELFHVEDFTALLEVCMGEEPNPQLFGLDTPFPLCPAGDVLPEPIESELPTAKKPAGGTEGGIKRRETAAREGKDGSCCRGDRVCSRGERGKRKVCFS